VGLAEAASHGREGRAHECQESTGGHQASLIGILRSASTVEGSAFTEAPDGIAACRAARRGTAMRVVSMTVSAMGVMIVVIVALAGQRRCRIGGAFAVTDAIRAVSVESPVIGAAGEDEFRHVVVNKRVGVGERRATIAANDITGSGAAAVTAVATVCAGAASAISTVRNTAGSAG